MSFDSLTYLVFLPIVAAGYRVLPQKFRAAWLLLAGVVFYASWNVPLTLLLFFAIAVSYAAGLLLGRLTDRGARRAVPWGAVLALVGLLLYFKYFRFLAESAASLIGLFGRAPHWDLWDVILPVGISFYTFQTLSYVFDVYRNARAPERNFGCYALYISFFPQLVAGPIERADALLPQLRACPTPTKADLERGLCLLLSGYFKKIVLADFCGVFVDRVYGAPSPDGSAVALGTLLFAVQIYCDFAGYSEIARGSAHLMGIRLMQNFDRPYLAVSVRDFWRRWHISLSGWLSDYVYIPLGGSRKGLLRQIMATLCVFLLSGLWHGANATFVLWGLMHGLLVVLWTVYLRLGGKEPQGRAGIALATALTFCLVTLLWIPFRAQSLSEAASLTAALFSPWNVTAGLSLLGMGWTDAARLMLSLGAFPLLWRLEQEKPRLPQTAAVLLIASVALAWLMRLGSGAASAFIYFQF